MSFLKRWALRKNEETTHRRQGELHIEELEPRIVPVILTAANPVLHFQDLAGNWIIVALIDGAAGTTVDITDASGTGDFTDMTQNYALGDITITDPDADTSVLITAVTQTQLVAPVDVNSNGIWEPGIDTRGIFQYTVDYFADPPAGAQVAPGIEAPAGSGAVDVQGDITVVWTGGAHEMHNLIVAGFMSEDHRIQVGAAPGDGANIDYIYAGFVAGHGTADVIDVNGSAEVIQIGKSLGTVATEFPFNNWIEDTDVSVEDNLVELDVGGSIQASVDVGGDLAAGDTALDEFEVVSDPAGVFVKFQRFPDEDGTSGLLNDAVNSPLLYTPKFAGLVRATPLTVGDTVGVEDVLAAQYLSSPTGTVTVDGLLDIANGDDLDVYAISALQGQTITIDFNVIGTGNADVQVFRLLNPAAPQLEQVDTTTVGGNILFTVPDTPLPGDGQYFIGLLQAGVPSNVQYTMEVSGLDTQTAGRIQAGQDYLGDPTDVAFDADVDIGVGSLGTLQAGNMMAGFEATVNNGNLGLAQADTMGYYYKVGVTTTNLPLDLTVSDSIGRIDAWGMQAPTETTPGNGFLNGTITAGQDLNLLIVRGQFGTMDGYDAAVQVIPQINVSGSVGLTSFGGDFFADATIPGTLDVTVIGGTMYGEMLVAGDVQILQVGGLHTTLGNNGGLIQIVGNVENLIINGDVNADISEPGDPAFYGDAHIRILNGNLNHFEVTGTFYDPSTDDSPASTDNTVFVEGDPLGGNVYNEVEDIRTPSVDIPTDQYIASPTPTNDTRATAEYVSSGSGDFTINGSLQTDDGDLRDIFEFSAMAGGTVTVSGVPGGVTVEVVDATFTPLSPVGGPYVIDETGNYYLVVTGTNTNYTFDVTGTAQLALGNMQVAVLRGAQDGDTATLPDVLHSNDGVFIEGNAGHLVARNFAGGEVYIQGDLIGLTARGAATGGQLWVDGSIPGVLAFTGNLGTDIHTGGDLELLTVGEILSGDIEVLGDVTRIHVGTLASVVNIGGDAQYLIAQTEVIANPDTLTPGGWNVTGAANLIKTVEEAYQGNSTVLGTLSGGPFNFRELENIREASDFVPNDAFMATQEVTNDSVATAEFLSASGADGLTASLTVTGRIQGTVYDSDGDEIATDVSDYYSVVAEQGETLNITIVSGAVSLTLTDWEGNVIATGGDISIASLDYTSQYYIQVTGGGEYTLAVDGTMGLELGHFWAAGGVGAEESDVYTGGSLTVGSGVVDADVGRIETTSWLLGEASVVYGADISGSLAVFQATGSLGVSGLMFNPSISVGQDQSVAVAIGGASYNTDYAIGGDSERFLCNGTYTGDITIGGDSRLVSVGDLYGVADEDGFLLYTGSLQIAGDSQTIIVAGSSAELIDVGGNSNVLSVSGTAYNADTGGSDSVHVHGNVLMPDPTYIEREVLRAANSNIPTDGLIAFQATTNDTCDTNEFVSSPSGNLVVEGELTYIESEEFSINDTVDWYGFGAEEGATVQVNISDPSLIVNIYTLADDLYAGDPENSIAGTAIEIDESGIYFIVVTRHPDAVPSNNPYTLTVTGLDEEIAGSVFLDGLGTTNANYPSGPYYLQGNAQLDGDVGIVQGTTFLHGNFNINSTPDMDGDIIAMQIWGSVGNGDTDNGNFFNVTIDGDVLSHIAVAGDNYGDWTVNGTVGSYVNAGSQYGDLDFAFNVDYIYVGNLYGNLSVDGNVNRLVVAGDTGIIPSGDITEPTEDFGTQVSITGNLYYYSIGGQQGAALTVNGDLSVVNFEYDEIEHLIGEIGPCYLNPDLVFNQTNDTLDVAEWISTPNGSLIINGDLEAGVDEDWIDYYRFVGTAGQTITIVPEADAPFYYAVGLFDAHQNLILTNAQNFMGMPDGFDGPDGFAGTPITYTLPETGVFYIGVSESAAIMRYNEGIVNNEDDVDTGVDGSVHTTGDTFDFSYRLYVEGLSSTTLGTMLVGSHMAIPGTVDVQTGDIGYLSAGGTVITAITAETGSLGFFRAGPLGTEDGANAPVGPNVFIAQDMWRMESGPFVTGVVQTGRDIGMARIAGDFGTATEAAYLLANDDIGHVRIEGFLAEGFVMADADLGVYTDGDVGNIDIFEATNGHDSGFYIVTTAGGDVRFCQVDGTIFYFDPAGGHEVVYSTRTVTGGPGGPETYTFIDDGGGELRFDLGLNSSLTFKEMPITGMDQFGNMSLKGFALTDLSISGDVDISATDYASIHTLTLTGDAITLNAVSNTIDNPRLDVYQVFGTLSDFTLLHGDVGLMDVTVATEGVIRDDPGVQGALISVPDGNIGLLDGLDGRIRLGVCTDAHQGLYIDPGVLPEATYIGYLDGVRAAGDVWSINVSGYLGNVIVEGNLHTVNYNTDGDVTAVPFGRLDPFEGVNGVIYASGDVDRVNLSDGLPGMEFFRDLDGNPRMMIHNTGPYATRGIFSGSRIVNVVDTGQGAVALEAPLAYQTAAGATDIITADFDNDGDLDFAVTNVLSESVSIYLNDGAGGFTSPYTYTVNSAPGGVAAGHFNADAFLDLAVTNPDDFSIAIFEGLGDGSFNFVRNVFVGGLVGNDAYSPDGIASADFNADGFDDLAVTLPLADSVGIFWSDGALDFFFTDIYAVGDQPGAIALGDFDAALGVDLAVANYAGDSVSVVYSAGGGLFNDATLDTFAVGTAPAGLAVGDLNSDGLLDIVTANHIGDNISLLAGTGAGLGGGGFVDMGTYDTGFQAPVGVAIGDFDGDLTPDIAVANTESDRVLVFYGDPAAAFWAENATQRAFTDDAPMGLAAGLFDADANLDLIVANYGSGNVSVILNDAGVARDFETAVEVSSMASPVASALGDLDGDGFMDVVILNRDSGSVTVFLGTTGGFIEEAADAFFVGNGPTDVTLADVNNDSRLDLVVTNGLDDQVYITLGDGDGTFSGAAVYAVGDAPAAVVVEDLDGDLVVDLVVVNEGSDNVSVLPGLGGGVFGAATNYAVGVDPTDAAVFDVDGDGVFDIVTTNSASGTISVLPGLGGGAFGVQTAYVAGTTPVALVASDFTGDGRTDVAVVDRTENEVHLLENLIGGFVVGESHPVGATPTSIVLADFDNDGVTDVLVANSGAGTLSALRGRHTGGFESQKAIDSVDNATGLSVALVDFDDRPDIVVVNPDGDSFGVQYAWANDIQGPIIGAGGLPDFVFADTELTGVQRVTVSNGARIRGVDAYWMPAVIQGRTDFINWHYYERWVFRVARFTGAPTSSIGTIEAVGAGSQIENAWINGVTIDKVSARGGANGVFNSDITATLQSGTPFSANSIGTFEVGGLGTSGVILWSGSGIGSIKAIEPWSDLSSLVVEAIDDVRLITSLRDITGVFVNVYGKTWRVHAAGSINVFRFEGEVLGELSADGDMLNLDVEHHGRMTRLQAGGEIGGVISALGPFGKINTISAGGDISADIYVWGTVNNIYVGGALTGSLEIADPNSTLRKLTLDNGGGNLRFHGNLGTLVSNGDLGDVEVDGTIGTIDVNGGDLTGDIVAHNVRGSRTAIRTIDVFGGDIGVFGGAPGEITAENGGIGKIIVQASTPGVASGGYANIDVDADGIVGNITVIGNGIAPSGTLDGTIDAAGIGTIIVRGGTEINATISAWTSGIKSIVNDGDGDIAATIYSKGAIGTVKTAHGDITGDITSDSTSRNAIGTVWANGGSVIGDVTATQGGIKLVKATADTATDTGGEIIGNVTAVNGTISGVTTQGTPGANTTGNISGDISAREIKNITVSDGDIENASNITAATKISKVTGKGEADIEGNFDADSIGTVSTDNGDITGTFLVHGTAARTAISNITAKAGNITSQITVNNGDVGKIYASYNKATGLGGNIVANYNIEGNAKNITTKGDNGAGNGNISGVINADQVGTVSATSGDITANITTDVAGIGTVKTLKGGAIAGNITSATQIKTVSSDGGDISGIITANDGGSRAIGKVSAKGGDITNTINSAGGISSITATTDRNTGAGGTISANVTAAGTLAKMTATSNSTALSGHITGNIQANEIGTIAAKYGNLTANVLSNGNIRSIGAGRNGDVNGAVIRAGGNITKIDGSNFTGTRISGANIRTFTAYANATNNTIAAGYDFGADGVYGGGDDTVGAGNITTVNVNGNLSATDIVAGIGPGPDNLFGTIDDVPDGSGLGTIGRINVKGTITGGAGVSFGFLANTGTFAVKAANVNLTAGAAAQIIDGIITVQIL